MENKVWTIETEAGGFEGSSLKEAVEVMTEYYAEIFEDEYPANINDISVHYPNGKYKTLASRILTGIQKRIERRIEELQDFIEQEKREKEIDYMDYCYEKKDFIN